MAKQMLHAINQYCFQNGIALNHLQMKKKSLETKFFELNQQAITC